MTPAVPSRPTRLDNGPQDKKSLAPWWPLKRIQFKALLVSLLENQLLGLIQDKIFLFTKNQLLALDESSKVSV